MSFRRLQFVLYAVAIIALAAAAVLFALAARAANDIHREIPALSSSLQTSALAGAMQIIQIRQHLDRDLVVMGSAATEWQKASKGQAGYWTQNSKKTGELLDEAKGSLSALSISVKQIGELAHHTDFDLNDLRSGAIPSIQGDAFAITQDLDKLSKQLTDLAQSMTLLTSHADDTVTDPVMREQLRASMESMSGTLGNVEAATADLRQRVHQMTRPASLAWRLVNGLFDGVVKGAQLYGGVH